MWIRKIILYNNQEHFYENSANDEGNAYKLIKSNELRHNDKKYIKEKNDGNHGNLYNAFQ